VLPFADQRKPLSILIVEEDAVLRDGLLRLLEAEGHRVRACDGREAPAALERGHFELLITDVLFPGRRTLEAVIEWSRTANRGRILGLCRFSRILPDYYLLLTAKLGIRVILPKPFDRAQLSEALEEVFADTQARWRGAACAAVA